MFFAVFDHLNDAVEIFLGFYFAYIRSGGYVSIYFKRKFF